MPDQHKAPVLYVITCATLAAGHVDVLIEQAQKSGWDPWMVSTPIGMQFIDAPALQTLTGHPVRSQYRRPDQPKQAPAADALVVAGASFNTINKWAAGIADNLAMSLLAELIGHIPTSVLPFLTDQLAKHPAFQRSITELHNVGAHVLIGPGIYEPHPSGTALEVMRTYPWRAALTTLTRE